MGGSQPFRRAAGLRRVRSGVRPGLSQWRGGPEDHHSRDLQAVLRPRVGHGHGRRDGHPVRQPLLHGPVGRDEGAAGAQDDVRAGLHRHHARDAQAAPQTEAAQALRVRAALHARLRHPRGGGSSALALARRGDGDAAGPGGGRVRRVAPGDDQGHRRTPLRRAAGRAHHREHPARVQPGRLAGGGDQSLPEVPRGHGPKARSLRLGKRLAPCQDAGGVSRLPVRVGHRDAARGPRLLGEPFHGAWRGGEDRGVGDGLGLARARGGPAASDAPPPERAVHQGPARDPGSAPVEARRGQVRNRPGPRPDTKRPRLHLP
mmetsp:Transcript_45348/g.102429  ORF Transcript_45348/g.102429 Transcript_45348/m.102429 type:complete len:317 (-) Transcript_45348:1755-2705(-)